MDLTIFCLLVNFTSRLILLLAGLYVHTNGADLLRLESLKKCVLEVLEDEVYKQNAESVELNELYAVLTQALVLNPAHALEPTATTSKVNAPIIQAGVALGNALRKQLTEDLAALRRISRVEGYRGADCKALIQSGKYPFHYTLWHSVYMNCLTNLLCNSISIYYSHAAVWHRSVPGNHFVASEDTSSCPAEPVPRAAAAHHSALEPRRRSSTGRWAVSAARNVCAVPAQPLPWRGWGSRP